MSLRRVRSHKVGISNIDFRTKGDMDNIKIFEPWHSPKDFGSMGYRQYRIPKKIFKSLFEPSIEINTQKDIVNDYPDPRYHTTAQFYKKNNILINTRTFFNSEKVANLEESFKGKEIFNGDSTNVAEVMRLRKGKKIENIYALRSPIKESFNIEDHKIREEKIKKLAKDKKKGNNNAIQETQLVKINTFIDKDNTINIKKIEEVRQALRRRYGNRKNMYKIFQLWAKTFPNKITVYDAYKMINSLSIPINYNETKAFIASGSNFGNEYLNMEEFANLIYEPVTMNVGNENKKTIYEEKEKDVIQKNIMKNNIFQFDSRNIEKLKDFISQRILVLNKAIKELSKEKYTFKEDNNDNKNHNVNLNLVDYDKFLKGILSLKPSDNIGKEEYIKKIFDEYKGNNGLVDMKFFEENIYEKNSKEFMTKFKDKNVEISKEQYNIKSNKLQKYVKENSGKIKPLFFQKKEDLDLQISEKNKLKENNSDFEKQLNSTIPSTKWLHHIYDNRKDHYNFLNRVEHSFSAKPSFKQNNLVGKTRFGANPPWKNTAEILIGDEKCGTFINEKDRFNLNRDIGKDDKKMKQLNDMGKQNRIRTALQKVENNLFMKMYLKEEKDIYSDMAKSKRIAIYDENTKNKNFIIE